MKPLMEKVKKYILKERERYKRGDETKKTRARVEDKRIRDKASDYLNYLTFLAEHLTEDQHKQVFTKESIIPLFEGFFRFASKYRQYDKEQFSSGVYDLKRAREKEVVIDKRLFQLSFAVATKCLYLSNMLIGDELRKLLLGDIRLHGLTDRELTSLSTIYRMLSAEKAREIERVKRR